MKKVLLLFLPAVFIMFMFAGCKKTPSDEIETPSVSIEPDEFSGEITTIYMDMNTSADADYEKSSESESLREENKTAEKISSDTSTNFIDENSDNSQTIEIDAPKITNINYTTAQKEIIRWLAYSLDYMYNDYAGLSGDLQIQYDNFIMYFVMDFANTGEGFTLARVQELVKTYFGIYNFMPPDDFRNSPDGKKEDGLYYMQGRGGEVWTFEFANETEIDGIIIVTVQFFADSAKTIKSHAIEYIMQKIDDIYRFIDSKVIYESPHKPFHYTD